MIACHRCDLQGDQYSTGSRRRKDDNPNVANLLLWSQRGRNRCTQQRRSERSCGRVMRQLAKNSSPCRTTTQVKLAEARNALNCDTQVKFDGTP